MNKHLIPERRWIATITYTDGRQVTTTIYGRNASQAEDTYLRADATVTRVIVRSEVR